MGLFSYNQFMCFSNCFSHKCTDLRCVMYIPLTARRHASAAQCCGPMSVHPSVTSQCSINTTKHNTTQTKPQDRPGTPAFWRQTSWWYCRPLIGSNIHCPSNSGISHDLEWPLMSCTYCKPFQMRFFVQLCSSWQDWTDGIVWSCCNSLVFLYKLHSYTVRLLCLRSLICSYSLLGRIAVLPT